MDDLLASLPSPPQPQAAPPQTARAPGRPSGDPEQRALRDARYAQQQDLLKALPADVTSPRLCVFRAKPNGLVISSRPIDKIPLQKWIDADLTSMENLKAFLEEKYGPGDYKLVAQDAHGKTCSTIPAFSVNTGDDDMPRDPDGYDADDYEDDRPTGRRRRPPFGRRPVLDDDDDLDLDLPRSSRNANMADFLEVQAQTKQQESQRSESMITAMIAMQQQQQAAAERAAADRREEDRRREEMRREEAKLEAEREVKREEARREEARREEDRRREEAKQAEDRRRDEMRSMMEASTKKMETLLGLATAAVPVISKLLEPRTDPTLSTVLAKVLGDDKKDTDPVTIMLLKNMLDGKERQSGITEQLQAFQAMQKVGSEMLSDQMRSVMQTSNEMQTMLIKRIMENMDNKDDDDDKPGMLGQIMDAVKGASEVVGTLTQGQPQGAPAQQPWPQMPQQDQQQQTPQQQQQSPQHPALPAPAVPAAPTGIPAVGAALKALQMGVPANNEEALGLVSFAIDNMPDNLRAAVVAGSEQQVLAICGDTFMATPDLSSWIMQPGVLDWLRAFVQNDLRQYVLSIPGLQEDGSILQPPSDGDDQVDDQEQPADDDAAAGSDGNDDVV